MNRPFLVAAGFELFISSAVGLSSSSSSIAFASSAFCFLVFCFSLSDVHSLQISSAVLLTWDFLPFPLPLLFLTSVSAALSFFFTLVFDGSSSRTFFCLACSFFHLFQCLASARIFLSIQLSVGSCLFNIELVHYHMRSSHFFEHYIPDVFVDHACNHFLCLVSILNRPFLLQLWKIHRFHDLHNPTCSDCRFSGLGFCCLSQFSTQLLSFWDV